MPNITATEPLLHPFVIWVVPSLFVAFILLFPVSIAVCSIFDKKSRNSHDPLIRVNFNSV